MAAFFQTLRFMLQKKLSMGQLSPLGATFARFVYAAPLAALLAGATVLLSDAQVPLPGGLFWVYALSGGLAQILATWCVVLLFAERNFAVGITFKKTEVIQTAILGLVVLGDRISLIGLCSILVGLVGVLVLSDQPRPDQTGPLRRFGNRAALLGLASGAFFAISAVGYRGATLEVASDIPFLRAMLTVAVVTAAQSLFLASYLRWREPGEVSRVWASRATSVWMGLASLGGSVGWFTAFTLQNAAYVFAVGQVEVLFSIAAAVLFFQERITQRELCGIALVTGSILLLVLLG